MFAKRRCSKCIASFRRNGRILTYSLIVQAMPMVLDPIQTGNVDDWDAMMDINVKGLLYVCQEVLYPLW
jgi:NADP-dependent 3-hydroxy acid dehydrogenase YdfG